MLSPKYEEDTPECMLSSQACSRTFYSAVEQPSGVDFVQVTACRSSSAFRERRFLTPEVTFEKPDGEYVAKGYDSRNDEPELNSGGSLYRELIPTEPVDYKWHAVNDRSGIHLAGRRVTSKLYGEAQFLDQRQIRPTLAASLRELVERFDRRGVGVDLVKDHDGQ